MNVPDHLTPFTEPQQVLSGGFVQLIGVFGDDNTIVNAARISFGKTADEFTPKANRHLLRYLMRGRHTTPFEMCEIMLRIRMPMDAHRQQIRHRTANVNEYSTRYKPAIDSCEVTEPDAWRSQSKDNKQGSGDFITEWPEGITVHDLIGGLPEGVNMGMETLVELEAARPAGPGEWLSAHERNLHQYARWVYEKRLALGVAKEQARKDLPLSTHTEYIWKMDLHNLFHYLSLRLDPHAQLEIRAFAQAIAEIVKVWVPWAWEAFEDYRLNAMYLTRFEVDALRALLQQYDGPPQLFWNEDLTPEQTEELREQVELALTDPDYTLITNFEVHSRKLSEIDPEELYGIAVKASGLAPKGREAADLRKKLERLIAPAEIVDTPSE